MSTNLYSETVPKVARHWWGSGNLDRCHQTIRSAPGSIPGQCIFFDFISGSPAEKLYDCGASLLPCPAFVRSLFSSSVL